MNVRFRVLLIFPAQLYITTRPTTPENEQFDFLRSFPAQNTSTTSNDLSQWSCSVRGEGDGSGRIKYAHVRLIRFFCTDCFDRCIDRPTQGRIVVPSCISGPIAQDRVVVLVLGC